MIVSANFIGATISLLVLLIGIVALLLVKRYEARRRQVPYWSLWRDTPTYFASIVVSIILWVILLVRYVIMLVLYQDFIVDNLFFILFFLNVGTLMTGLALLFQTEDN